MITEPTYSLKDCRSDYDDLVLLDTGEREEGELFVGVKIYSDLIGLTVALVHGAVRSDVLSAEEVARRIAGWNLVRDRDHLVITLANWPDGLEKALDEELGGQVRITRIVQRQMSAAEMAVPMPPKALPVAVSLMMSEDDFECLGSNSTTWGMSWASQLERFETVNRPAAESPSLNWKMAYWVGSEYAGVLLAGAFIRAQGFDFEVVLDLAPNPECEYVILTDFLTASWKQSEERANVRSQEREAQFRALLEEK